MKPRTAARFLLRHSSVITVAISSLVVSESAQAAVTWNGLTNGTWSTVGNWSAAPTLSDDLTILGPGNAAGALTINVDTAANAKSINFTDTSAVSLTNTTSGADKTLTIAGASGITVGTGAVTIGSTTTNQAVNIALGATQTWTIGAGGLTVNNGVSGSGFGLTKAGTGTLTLNGANTYSGATTISAGTLTLSGASGAISSSSGITVGTGGTLKLDNTSNTNNDRLANAIPLTLSGGGFTYAVSTTAGSFSESVGALSLTSGSTITTNQAVAGQTSTLTFASLTRNTGAGVNFSGTLDGSRNKIVFTDTTGVALTSGIIGPWATYNSTDWATYGANGIGLYGGYTNINALGSTIADGSATNVKLTAAGSGGSIVLGSATTSVNTLLQGINTAATVATAGKTLRTSGIMTGGTAQTLTIGAAAGDGTLTALTSGGELVLNTNFSSTSSIKINAVIADNTSASSLTKLGPYTAILAANNTYTGPTNVSGGSLIVTGGLSSSPVSVNSGGTLQIGSVGTTGTIGGNVTLNTGGTLIYNRTDLSTPIAGALTGAGGAITVSNGTLNLNSTNLAAGSTNTFGTVNLTAASSGLVVNGSATSNNTFTAWQMNNTASTAKVQLAGGVNNMTTSGLFYSGALYVTGGTNNFSINTLIAGYQASGYAYLGVTAGTLTGSQIGVGWGTSSIGVMDVSAGNHTIIGGGGNSALYLGNAASAVGVYNQTGGSVTTTNNGIITVGGNTASTGRGEFNLRGGTFGGIGTTGGYNLTIGTGASNTGVVNLDGGTLYVNTFNNSGNASGAYLNFNGGTLAATVAGKTLSAAVAGNIIVNSGGATIDDGGVGLTISAPILAPTGSGVTGLPWGSTLTGYTGAPYVSISGGGGTGATAVATYDYSTGSVTGITITNPGTGYTSGPTVTLKGGGVADNSLGSATYGANTSGGLTKTGSSTLTLSGASTYTGATTVSQGTLTLNSKTGSLSSSSALTMQGGSFNMDNTGATGALTQSLGALSIKSGDSTVKTTRTVAQDEVLTFSSLAARTVGATGNFVNGGGTNSATNGFNLTGAAAGFIDQGYFYGGSAYAWMNAAGTYVRAINYSGDTNATASAGATSITPGSNVHFQTTGAITAQSTQTFTTLNLAGTTTAASAFTLTSGATLTVNGILRSGNTASTSAVISGGTGIKAASGAELVIRTDGANDALTISSSILANGTNALTKSGAGTLTLSGTNTYTGATAINAGVLSVATTGALPGWDTNGKFSVATGATLAVGNAVTDANITTLLGTTNFAAGANLGFDTTSGNRTWSAALANTAQGTLGLTKIGVNTLTLSNTSTNTGNITIAGGTLVANPGVGWNTAVNMNLNGGVLGVSSNLTTTIGTGAGQVQFNASFSGFSAIGGAATVDLGSTAINYTNSIPSGRVMILNGPGADSTLTFATPITSNIRGYIEVDSGTAILNKVWSSSGSNVIHGKVGAGTLQLDAGWTVIGSAHPTIYGGTMVINNSALNAVATESIIIGGDTAASSSISSVANSPATLTVQGASATVTGLNLAIGNTNASGTVNLNGGVTTVNQVKLGSGTGTLNFDGGTLKTMSSTSAATFMTGLTNAFIKAGGAIFDTNSFDTTVAQVLKTDVTSTGGGLTKTGLGALVLSGTNTFTGKTVVQNGTISFSTGNSSATANQQLGANNTVDLGVASTSSGKLLYTGAAGTLAKNVNALGNGSDTIQNSGTGLLTLSGTLTKNGTILNLQGGTYGINVTGTIAGINSGSDLYVNGGTVTLSNTNTYNGPTFVNSGATLALGINNAIPSNSAVTLGDATTTGTLNLGSYTNTLGSLAFGAGGGTLKMAANQTSSAQLAASGTVVLGSGNTLDLTGMSTTAGLYKLVSGSSLTGTFLTVTGQDSNYNLVYSGTELDAQHKATIALAAGSNPSNVRVGSQTINLSIGNTAPTGSADLSYTLGGLTGSGTRTAGAGSSAATGTYTAVAGSNSFSITATDSNATNSPQTISFSQTGYNPAAAASSQTVNLYTRPGVGITTTLSVTNSQSATAPYQETLGTTGFSGTTTGFSATGSATGIAGGASGSGSLMVGVTDSAVASSGVHSGSTTLGLQTEAVNGSGLGNLGIVGQSVDIEVVVYDFATATFSKTDGAGSFSGSGTSYTLNFGTGLALNTDYKATISLANGVFSAYKDALGGNYGTLTGAFSTDATNFASLTSGGNDTFTVTFHTDSAGNYSSNLTFDGTSLNGHLGDTALPDGTVNISLSAVAVPEPDVAALISGFGVLALLRRRR